MKIFRSLAVTATAVLALGLAGCGGSDSGSAAPAANTVAINGTLEPGAAKSTLKAAAATVSVIGTVTAIDAATGSVISTAPADVIADSTGTGGTFSGLTITPPSTQAGIILKTTLNNGRTYRAIITTHLHSLTTPITATIGPNSDAVVAAASSSLGVSGTLGDSGVKLPATATLATVAGTVSTVSATVLPKLAVGYVINTGGSGTKLPGFSIIDRATKTVTRTVRFTNLPGVRVNHFGNVTADGSELWLCSNRAGGVTGDVNVYDVAGFGNYSTLNDSNKGTLVKKSWNVGCGVQNVQSPDGRYVFVSSDQSPRGINVFDVKNKAFLGNIVNNNTAPHVGAVSADGKRYYTSTAGSFHAVGYDISGLPVTVPTDADKVLDLDLGYGNIHAIRLHPNGRYLFVGNNTWPVPVGKTSTSGVNVIDLVTKKIIANLPGRPHNFAISLDGKYLISTESTAADCDITPGDPASLLQFIDISTLLDATPDPAKIKDILHYNHPGYGGSHAGWDPTTGLLYYAVSADSDGQGWLIKIDTSGLSHAVPHVTEVGQFEKIGWAPHGVLFPGINGD